MEFSLNPTDFNPKHTASGCIIYSGNRILLLKSFSGVWSIPAGKMEQDETPEQAVIREVREETKLELEKVTLKGKYNVRLKKYDFVYYLFETRLNEKPIVTISGEHEDHEWVSPSELDDLNLETGAEVYKEIIQN